MLYDSSRPVDRPVPGTRKASLPDDTQAHQRRVGSGGSVHLSRTGDTALTGAGGTTLRALHPMQSNATYHAMAARLAETEGISMTVPRRRGGCFASD